MKKATLVFIINENRVLLGEKKRGEIGTGIVTGPGGKLEPDETLEECVVRETLEEWGLTLEISKLELVAVITFFAAGEADFEVYVYRTEHFEGEIKETDDAYAPAWYPLNNLPFERMFEGDRAWFDKAARGEKFSAKVYYKTRAQDFDRIEFFPFSLP